MPTIILLVPPPYSRTFLRPWQVNNARDGGRSENRVGHNLPLPCGCDRVKGFAKVWRGVHPPCPLGSAIPVISQLSSSAMNV